MGPLLLTEARAGRRNHLACQEEQRSGWVFEAFGAKLPLTLGRNLDHSPWRWPAGCPPGFWSTWQGQKMAEWPPVPALGIGLAYGWCGAFHPWQFPTLFVLASTLPASLDPSLCHMPQPHDPSWDSVSLRPGFSLSPMMAEAQTQSMTGSWGAKSGALRPPSAPQEEKATHTESPSPPEIQVLLLCPLSGLSVYPILAQAR